MNRLGSGDEGVFIDTDVAQFTQALLKLAINARDAMARGGEIAIGMNTLDVGEYLLARHPKLSPGPHLLIDVQDEGEGDSRCARRPADRMKTWRSVGKGARETG